MAVSCPVKASGWLATELSDEERKKLIRSGIVPVNDIFYPLWGNSNKINGLYGGFGSGKSVFVQTLLLFLCRQKEYFRCYYGRKVLEDVRGSVHSKFVTLIKDYGLQSEFRFSEENNGSMVIRHKSTGNSFHPFGGSKSEGLKSIDDPTHFFLEEADQFTLDDFGVILSRLRTQKSKTQLYMAFNTGRVFPDHWIRKIFFAQEDENVDLTEAEQELISEIKSFGVEMLFCNYTDNYFIDHADYYSKLVIAAAGDDERLNASAKGEWGSEKAVNVFATAYSAGKHESREAVFRPGTPIRFIFDFNINPFAVNMAHVWRDDAGEHCHIFDEMSVQAGSIPKMCDEIKMKYGQYLPGCYITGDSMGKRRDIGQRDHSSSYAQIRNLLRLQTNQLKLPSNPTHENSRSDVNYVLYNFPDFKINPKTCPNTCRDMKMVECDVYGEIIKKNRNNVDQRADHLDNVRYLINTFLKTWIAHHQKTHRL